MSELDIMRGFVPPNTEKSFVQTSRRSIRTTDPDEHNYLREASPVFIARFFEEGSFVSDTNGQVEIRASEQAVTALVKKLEDIGFKPKTPYELDQPFKIETSG